MLQNNEVKTFKGCDGTMENCSAISKFEIIYDPNPNNLGCRLRCHGMIHEIDKDANGKVVNVCRKPSTISGGRRMDSKRKKKKWKIKKMIK